jgi:hypothetical protein
VILAIVSGLVLVIVCVNIANLFLAGASARRHELSLRLAVGAPRWRLARLRPDAAFCLSVRAVGAPAHLVPGLAAALRRVDPRLAYTFRPPTWTFARPSRRSASWRASRNSWAQSRYCSRRSGSTALVRTPSRAAAVVSVILARIGVFVLAGTVVGLLVALWLARFVAPLLYGLESRDPVTLTAATATLASVTVLAGWIPASSAVTNRCRRRCSGRTRNQGEAVAVFRIR